MTGEFEELGARRREMLRGKPLRGRPVWLLGPLAFAAFLVVVVVLLAFVDGLWLAIGLTVLAFPAGMLPELLTDVRYSQYRTDWEIFNEVESFDEAARLVERKVHDLANTATRAPC